MSQVVRDSKCYSSNSVDREVNCAYGMSYCDVLLEEKIECFTRALQKTTGIFSLKLYLGTLRPCLLDFHDLLYFL